MRFIFRLSVVIAGMLLINEAYELGSTWLGVLGFILFALPYALWVPPRAKTDSSADEMESPFFGPAYRDHHPGRIPYDGL